MASTYNHTANREALNAYMKHFTEGNVDAIMELLVSAKFKVPKYFFLRILPSNMTAQVSPSMMEYGRLLQ